MGTVGTVLGMGTSPKSDHAGQPARSASPAIPTPEQAPGQSDQADCQPSTPGDNSQLAISERASVSPGDQKTSTGETSTSNDPDLHQVKQSLVALPDLRAAVQADSQTDLTWDGRGIWFQSKPDDDTYIKRRLTWILVGQLRSLIPKLTPD